jgi:hypothetical protein
MIPSLRRRSRPSPRTCSRVPRTVAFGRGVLRAYLLPSWDLPEVRRLRSPALRTGKQTGCPALSTSPKRWAFWWPLATHKIGKAKAVDAVIEPRVGGAPATGVGCCPGNACAAGALLGNRRRLEARLVTERRITPPAAAHLVQVRQDVHDPAEWIARVKAPNAPRLIDNVINDLKLRGFCAVIDLVDIVDLNRQIGNGGPRPAILGHHSGTGGVLR